MSRKAIIAGASGLIGSNLLKILLTEAYYDEVLILVRKELPISHKKLVQVIINFDDLDNYVTSINGEAIFCCLGSTKKKTPDLTTYRKIDHDYPLKLAQLGRENNVKQYHLVSSLGADSKSSNFYAKMKGETEDDLRKLGLLCLHIYEPSFLKGDRQEDRPLERLLGSVMTIIDHLLIGRLKKYRSIPAQTVAMAMYKQSLKNEEGTYVYLSDEIKILA